MYAVVYQKIRNKPGICSIQESSNKQRVESLKLRASICTYAANLVQNAKDALEGLPLRHGYIRLDISVALHWIKGGGSYKQSVANRVEKLNEKSFIL